MATTSTSTSTRETFTPSMRDRQARGQDPYSTGGDAGPDDEDDMLMNYGQTVRKHHETWEQKERTGFATRVLANPDLLLWHAQARGDSVAAQRLRFTAMLCGYDDYYGASAAPVRRSGSASAAGTGEGAATSGSGGQGASGRR